MKNRIGAFLALPLASLDSASLRARLGDIGTSEGSTSPRRDVA
jgi:arsenate reductase